MTETSIIGKIINETIGANNDSIEFSTTSKGALSFSVKCYGSTQEELQKKILKSLAFAEGIVAGRTVIEVKK